MPNTVYEEKKRFNVIDVMIIIAALLIIFGIIFRAQIIDVFNSGGKQTTFTVTFEADSVPNALAEKIVDGEGVTWLEKSLSLGTLSGIEKTPSTIYVPNTESSLDSLLLPYKDGTYNALPSAELTKITGSFTALGSSKNGCYVNGTDFLAAGMTVTVVTATAELQVTVTSITAQ